MSWGPQDTTFSDNSKVEREAEWGEGGNWKDAVSAGYKLQLGHGSHPKTGSTLRLQGGAMC